MNTRYYCKQLITSLLLTGSILVTVCDDANADNKSRKFEERSIQEKTGYEVDGRTSASVLAAQRSHSVGAKDKMGLAIYSGIFVIGLIVFFVQLLNEKNK